MMSMLSPDRQTNEKNRKSELPQVRITDVLRCTRCANAAKTVPDNKNGTPGLALRVPPLFERGYASIEITARFARNRSAIAQTLLMMLSPMA